MGLGNPWIGILYHQLLGSRFPLQSPTFMDTLFRVHASKKWVWIRVTKCRPLFLVAWGGMARPLLTSGTLSRRSKWENRVVLGSILHGQFLILGLRTAECFTIELPVVSYGDCHSDLNWTFVDPFIGMLVTTDCLKISLI